MARNALNLLVSFSEKGLAKLNGGMKNLVGLGKTGASAFRDLKRDASALERELKDVRSELAGASGNVTALIDRERQLERSIEGVNAELEKRSKLYKIDRGAEAMRQRGADLRAKGRDNLVGGAAMLAPIGLALAKGAQFSSQMVDIQQKANLSDAATAQMRNNIIDAARASAQMPDEIASSVESLAGLGMDPREAAKLALPMGRFMTAFKAQGTDTAASLYAGIETLNIPLAQAQKFLDMMAEGGNQGAFEVKDMAGAMPGLTAQMKALGQTGRGAGAELVAMLQIVRRGTGDSATAATRASDLLSKLTAPATMKAFEKAGVDAMAAIEAGGKNGISPLETMIELTRKATGGDLKKLGYLFADKEASGAMRQLMLDYEDFVAMKKDVGAAEGTTDTAFAGRMKNDQLAQLQQLGSAASGLLLSVVPVLTPALTSLTQAIPPVVSGMADWARANPELAGFLLKSVAAIGMARIALGGLQFAFGGLLGPLATAHRYFAKVDGVSRFADHLDKFKGAAKATASVAGKAFMLLRSGALFFARGIVQAGVMMLANPMVLAIVAIVAAVGLLSYAIYANWDRIKAGFGQGVAWLSGAWQTVKGKFFEGLAFVQGLGSRFLSMGKNLILGLARGITSAPGAVFAALKDVVMGGVSRIKNLLGIRSPSRLFMGFGNYLSEGMAIGIDQKRQQAFASARRLATGVAGAAVLGAPAVAGAAGAGSANSARAPVSISAPITIVQRPGEDNQDLADRVQRTIEKLAREDQARRNSSYADG